MKHLRNFAIGLLFAALLLGTAVRSARAQSLFIVGALSNFDCYNTTPTDCEGFEIEIEGIHKEQVLHTWAYSIFGAPTVTDGGTAAAPSAIVRYHSNTVVLHSGGVTHFGVTLSYYTVAGTVLRRWIPAVTLNVPNPAPIPYVLPTHQAQLTTINSVDNVHDAITNDTPDGVTILWVLPFSNKISGRHVSLEELMPNNPVVTNAVPAGSGPNHDLPIMLTPGMTYTNDELPTKEDTASGILWFNVYADVVTGQRGKTAHQPGALIGRVMDATITVISGATPGSIALSDAFVYGTQDVIGKVTLAGGALAGGTTVTLSADNPNVSLPASVTVTVNQNAALFTINTLAVAARTTVHITASAGGVSQTVSFDLLPPDLHQLYLTFASVGGGKTLGGTVFLTSPAPTGGATIALTSDSLSAELPATLTVPAGATSAPFTVVTHVVTAPVTVNFTATLYGLTQAAALKIVPNSVPVSGLITLEGLAANAPTQNVIITFRPIDGSASFDKSVPIGASNGFNFADIPANLYTLHFHCDRYLSANVTIDASNRNVSGLTVMLPAGDANSDNSVDSSDFGILIGAFNTAAALPGSGYDPTADFNSDGVVDSTDFGLLIGNYGSVGAN